MSAVRGFGINCGCLLVSDAAWQEEVGRLKQQMDAAAAREEQLQGQIRESQLALERGHSEAMKRLALVQVPVKHLSPIPTNSD